MYLHTILQTDRDSCQFAEFSKKCSERWKTMLRKEKSKFDGITEAIKYTVIVI